IASWTSPPASALTFPISPLIRSVSAAFSAFRSSAKQRRTLARSGARTRRHSSKASRARATAWPTSSAVERGNRASTPPVAGRRAARVASDVGALLVGGCGGGDPARVGAAPLARDALALELGRVLAGAPVRAAAPVDDHRHVRVVGVVRGELLEELRLELPRD